MTDKELLSLLAGIIYLVGCAPYWYAIVKKGVTPQRSTWTLFFLLNLLGIESTGRAGVFNGQLAAATLGSTMTLILCIRRGDGGTTKLDIGCFMIGAIGGSVLVADMMGVRFPFFRSEEVALGAGMIAGFIATAPTFRSAWQTPEKEDKTAWTLFLASCLPSFGSITEWTFMSVGQPATFFVSEAIILALLLIRQPKKGVKP